jgi:hypothetical protein
LSPFAIANNLSPGRIIGISGVGVGRLSYLYVYRFGGLRVAR